MTGLMTQKGNESPTFEDIIREAIRSNQLEINTMMPATVVSYDSAKQTCEVQPSLKRTYIDPPSVISRPRIKNVPVIFPRVGSYGVSFPIATGDKVALVFSQRSLDDWKNGSGEVQVRDIRLHDINDAVAIPGLYQSASAISPVPATDGTDIRGDKIYLGKTGAPDEPIVLGNVLKTNLETLIDSITDLIALIKSGAALGTATVAAFGTPGPVSSTILTTAVENSLTSLKSALSDQNSDFIFGEKG